MIGGYRNKLKGSAFGEKQQDCKHSVHMGIHLFARQQDITDTVACWNTWMRLGKDGNVLLITGSFQ